jgi:hypothetical protein
MERDIVSGHQPAKIYRAQNNERDKEYPCHPVDQKTVCFFVF